LQGAVQPGGAETHLGGSGTAVTAAIGPAAGKAGGRRGDVDAVAEVSLVAETGAHHPAHELPPRTSREGPLHVLLDGPGRLADEHDPLPGAAAEHGVGAGDEARVGAAGAGAMSRLQLR